MTTHSCTCQTAPLSPETLTKVDAIIARHKDQPGALMPVLQEVQEAVGYLPPQVQERIALGLNIQGSEVFGVMSFYSMYTWKPKGKYVVRMCESPPCHVNGAENMFHALQQELGDRRGRNHRRRPLHPGTHRLPGGLRSGARHADQRSGGGPPHPRQDQAGLERLPHRQGG